MTEGSHDDELRRKNDIQLAELVVRFNDFLDRYERDTESADASRAELMRVIRSHDEFIKDIKPVYAKGMMALGAAFLGSVGIAVHWLWSHVKWG